MSRIKISTNSKAEKVSKNFPDEFKVLNKLLWCNLCKSYVNWEKKIQLRFAQKWRKAENIS